MTTVVIADLFYTGRQAADALGITNVTVWRWIRQGKLAAQYIGGVSLIPKWKVELLAEARTHGRTK